MPGSAPIVPVEACSPPVADRRCRRSDFSPPGRRSAPSHRQRGREVPTDAGRWTRRRRAHGCRPERGSAGSLRVWPLRLAHAAPGFTRPSVSVDSDGAPPGAPLVLLPWTKANGLPTMCRQGGDSRQRRPRCDARSGCRTSRAAAPSGTVNAPAGLVPKTSAAACRRGSFWSASVRAGSRRRR